MATAGGHPGMAQYATHASSDPVTANPANSLTVNYFQNAPSSPSMRGTSELRRPGNMTNIEKLNVTQLRARLQDYQADTEGLKPALLARLTLCELGVQQIMGANDLVDLGGSLWGMNAKKVESELEKLGLERPSPNVHKRDIIAQILLFKSQQLSQESMGAPRTGAAIPNASGAPIVTHSSVSTGRFGSVPPDQYITSPLPADPAYITQVHQTNSSTNGRAPVQENEVHSPMSRRTSILSRLRSITGDPSSSATRRPSLLPPTASLRSALPLPRSRHVEIPPAPSATATTTSTRRSVLQYQIPQVRLQPPTSSVPVTPVADPRVLPSPQIPSWLQNVPTYPVAGSQDIPSPLTPTPARYHAYTHFNAPAQSHNRTAASPTGLQADVRQHETKHNVSVMSRDPRAAHPSSTAAVRRVSFVPSQQAASTTTVVSGPTEDLEAALVEGLDLLDRAHGYVQSCYDNHRLFLEVQNQQLEAYRVNMNHSHDILDIIEMTRQFQAQLLLDCQQERQNGEAP